MLQTYNTEMTFLEGVDEDEVTRELEVQYYYTPGSPGRRERGSGIPLEPDEGANVEILGVIADGEPIYLSKEQLAEIEDQILESESEQ